MKLALMIMAGVMLSLLGTWTVWNAVSGSDSCPYSPKPQGAVKAAETEGSRSPVLVELFTSEGCSSCPPADRQLAFIQQNQPSSGAEVIALAYHVDYWDRLGWKDRFSSAQFSDRQNSYSTALQLDSNYTPQMIVDGRTQFVGSDARKADQAVTEAAVSEKGKAAVKIEGEVLKISVSELPEHGHSEIYLAVAEDGLETDVRAGENGGRKLAHAAVVRSLKEIGEIAAGEAKSEITVQPLVDKEWKAENLRYVIFVQETKTKRVLAVGSANGAGK